MDTTSTTATDPRERAVTGFVLRDGRIIAPEKDCTCRRHEGPHWLYHDAVWRKMNRALLDDTGDPVRNALGRIAFPREESARLREKMFQMRRRGIERILYGENAA